MSDIEKIIEEEYQKIIHEQAKDDAVIERNLEAVMEQLKEHSDLLREVVYYLTTVKEDSEAAKKFVQAHGNYVNSIKEIMDLL